jgi:hypothetical protein
VTVHVDVSAHSSHQDDASFGLENQFDGTTPHSHLRIDAVTAVLPERHPGGGTRPEAWEMLFALSHSINPILSGLMRPSHRRARRTYPSRDPR